MPFPRIPLLPAFSCTSLSLRLTKFEGEIDGLHFVVAPNVTEQRVQRNGFLFQHHWYPIRALSSWHPTPASPCSSTLRISGNSPHKFAISIQNCSRDLNHIGRLQLLTFQVNTIRLHPGGPRHPTYSWGCKLVVLHVGLVYCKIVGVMMVFQTLIMVVHMLGMGRCIRRWGISWRNHVHRRRVSLGILNICSLEIPNALMSNDGEDNASDG
jgi:hypothetical protein